MAQVRHGHSTRAGGISKTYRAWSAMRIRCVSHPRWAGRGIAVCERWASFENFLADMGDAPPGMSLDRIDNNGNYEPGNCRWASPATQASNRRSTRYIEHDGKRMTLTEWAAHLGCAKTTLTERIKRGSSPAEAVAQPARTYRRTA